MSDEFISQDEVDALLTGVDAADAVPAVPEPAGTVRRLDLAVQDHAARGPMPALEAVNARMCRQLPGALFKFMGRLPGIVAGPARAVKYAEFAATLPTPANAGIVQLAPLRGNALVVLDPALVYVVVDSLFGGDGRFQPRAMDRGCTPTEVGIVQRTLGVILAEYAKAWKELHPLAFSLLRTETSLQSAKIAGPADVVVAMTFTVECGAGTGAFHIGIPYAALEPIRDLIHGSGEADEPRVPDPRWERTIATQVRAAEVELVADLVTLPVTVKQLLGLSVGDILDAEIPQIVTAQVDGVPLFDCRFGTLNGQYALRIASVLTPDREPTAGALHAR